MNLLSKPPMGLKTAKEGRDPGHMKCVAGLPCVICHHYGMQQLSNTQVHHCIHGRYGNRRVPDSMTIPLCEGHHQGLVDTSKIALHREPTKWKDEYGWDVDFIHWTKEKIGATP